MEYTYLRTDQEPGTTSGDLVTVQVSLVAGTHSSALNPKKLKDKLIGYFCSCHRPGLYICLNCVRFSSLRWGLLLQLFKYKAEYASENI